MSIELSQPEPGLELDVGPLVALRRIEPLVEAGRLDEATALLAPVVEQFPDEYWVRRLQARATVEPAVALRRWYALRLGFPLEPQTHIDLAQALRDHVGDHDTADAVLLAALPRFADHLWLLDSLAVAAERRQDWAAAADWWRRLDGVHCEHARARAGLIANLTRLGRHDEVAALLGGTDLEAAGPAPLRHMAELAAEDPAIALDRWALMRALHPREASGHLGYVRALRALGRGEECNEILEEARHVLPGNPDIAIAWATDAVLRCAWAQAVLRCEVLQALAPAALATALLYVEALIECGRPAEALALLGPARVRFADQFWLAHHEVRALNLTGRWQAALAAGRAVMSRWEDEPQACMGVAYALERLGRVLEAEAVLRAARERFPDESWIAVPLARAAAARGAMADAVAWWRAAGLPASGTAEQLRRYVGALTAIGDVEGARAALQSAADDRAGARWLLLAEAELDTATRALPAALAAWGELCRDFTVADPDFAALTWSLARTVDAAAASPLLQALLDEPDQDGEDWCPVLGRALAATAAADPLCQTLRVMLETTPGPPTLAREIALSLVGRPLDPDALSERMVRAINDGRPHILALLLENTDEGQTARLRVALRLLVNRNLAGPESLEVLQPRQVAALLMVTRVLDPESFAYVTMLARSRFLPARPPSLPAWADVVGCIVHRRLPGERPAPEAELAQRLCVAVCLHGRALAAAPAQALRAALRLEAHDSFVFAHLWHAATAAEVAPEHVIDSLPRLLRQAVRAAIASRGLAQFNQDYPGLLEAMAQTGPDRDEIARRTGCVDLVMEDADAPHLCFRPAAWRARYKVMLAHQLAMRSGRSFDLILHVDAGVAVQVPEMVDWRQVALRARRDGVVFADQAMRFRRGSVLAMGDALVAGARAEMAVAADSFGVAEFAASGHTSIAGLVPLDIHVHSQPVLLHLMGARVEALPGVSVLQPPAHVAAIPAGVALARLWKILKARPPRSGDVALLRAATADATGGLGL